MKGTSSALYDIAFAGNLSPFRFSPPLFGKSADCCADLRRMEKIDIESRRWYLPAGAPKRKRKHDTYLRLESVNKIGDILSCMEDSPICTYKTKLPKIFHKHAANGDIASFFPPFFPQQCQRSMKFTSQQRDFLQRRPSSHGAPKMVGIFSEKFLCRVHA